MTQSRKGGGVRGGSVGTGIHRAPDSRCGARRHNTCLCLQWLQRSDQPGDSLGGASPLSRGGEVCVQLLQALGAAYSLTAW